MNAIYSPNYIPKENLTIYTGRNYTIYEYSEKVSVSIKYSNRKDTLTIRGNKQNNTFWIDSGKVILEKDFDKVANHENKLLILAEKTYYVFDISNYILDAESEYVYPENTLYEYTEEEFIKLYPEHESFDWYGH